MGVTFAAAGEDLLPDVADVALASVTGQAPEAVAESSPLASLLKGCYGFAHVAEICYDVNVDALTVQVQLKVGGITVGTWHLSAADPRTKISINVLLFKCGLEVVLDIDGSKLTMNGQACYRSTPWSSWHCADFDVTLIHW